MPTIEQRIDDLRTQMDAGAEPASLWMGKLEPILDEIVMSNVDSLPAAGSSGIEFGEIVRLNGAALGQSPLWVNAGSNTSSKLIPLPAPVAGYAPVWGFLRDDITGNAATNHAYVDDALAADLIFAQMNETDNNEWMLTAITGGYGKVTVTASADGSGAVSHSVLGLRQYGIPGYAIVAAGEYACVADDDTTVAITVAGVKAGDIGFAMYSVADDTTDIIQAVCCTTNTVTITVSNDPGAANVHKWDYVVFRKLDGSFQPSHYIAYAGAHTSVGGDATEAITITGALATDTAVISLTTMDDTDNVGKGVVTANTLTLTCSADPTASAKVYNYMILRSY